MRKLNNELHSNFSSGNKTNTTHNSTKGAIDNTIVSKAPFKASKCDQILMLPGKRIFPENDYGRKADAFFTMSAFLLNTFEKKDSSSLVKSLKLMDIDNAPYILQGSKNCLFFWDSAPRSNTTVCIEDAKQREDIISSFNFLKKCKPKQIKRPNAKTSNYTKVKMIKKGNSTKSNSKPKKNKKLNARKSLNVKQFFKTIQNPNQKVYNIPKVRNALLKELNKKGVFIKLYLIFVIIL